MTSIVTNSNNATMDNYVRRDLELNSDKNTNVDFNNHLLSAINNDKPKLKHSDDDSKKSIADSSDLQSNIFNPIVPFADNINDFNIQKKNDNIYKPRNNKAILNHSKNISKSNNAKATHSTGKKVKKNDKFVNSKPKITGKNETKSKVYTKNIEINKKFNDKLTQLQLVNKPIRSSKQLNFNSIKNINQFHLIQDKLDAKITGKLSLKSLRIKTIKIDAKKSNKIIHKENGVFANTKNNKRNNIKNDTNKKNSQIYTNSQIEFSDINTKPIIISEHISVLKSTKASKEKSKKIVRKESINGNIKNKSENQKFDNISRLNNNKTKTKNNSLINQEVTKVKTKLDTKNQKNNFQNLINTLKTIDSNHNNNTNNVSNVNTSGYDSSYEVKSENLIKTITNISKNVSNNSYHTARLVMQPESLGTIIVKIIIQNNIAKLNIDVGSEKAMKNIENQIGLLKSNLAQEGIKAEKIEITQQKNDGLNNKNEKKKNDNYKQNYQVIEEFINSFKNIKEY